MEYTIATISATASSGDTVKIDYAFGVQEVVTANWSFSAQIRIYDDTTIIHTRNLSRSGGSAGTFYLPVADTYVDARTTSTTQYTLRVIVTAVTAVTNLYAVRTDLNIMVF